MEVNFISTGPAAAPAKSSKPSKAAPAPNAPKKGWKAKRRAAVMARPRVPRAPGGAKGRTAAIATDEFSSGIAATEKEAEKVGGEEGVAEPGQGAGKKRKAGGEGEGEGERKSEGVDAEAERRVRKKARRDARDVKAAAEARAAADGDAAVAATLDVMADEPEPEVDEAEAVPEADATGGGVFDAAGAGFEAAGLYPSVARHLVLRLGMARPTAVQARMLGVVLPATSPIDVLVRSATGSGKTLAYLMPIAHFLLQRPRRLERENGSLAIVVVPTRELAEQVEDVATRLFRPWHWIVVGSLRGGENKRHEKARLRKGISVLVATPGRLVDHIRNTKSFNYSNCEFLVLDEADRLLDLGFEADIKEFIKSLNTMQACGPDASQRCNFLLSATLNNDVERLAEFSLKKPIEVSAAAEVEGADGEQGDGPAQFAMPEHLRQHFSVVDQKYRLVTLGAFLRLRALKGLDAALPAEVRESKETIGAISSDDPRLPECKIIVFFSTCDSVDFHHELFEKVLRPREFTSSVDSCLGRKLLPLQLFRIHGTRSQADRVAALRGFRKSRRAVLFCTDVAARGLDLKGVSFAIQYDPPTGGHGEELEYLHRAGRTARAGQRGDALIFLLPSEKQYVRKLESAGANILEISGNAALAALVPRAKLDHRDDINYSARLATSALQEALELPIRNSEQLKALAYTGFRAYCRAYATHAKETKHFFHVRNLHLGHVARAFAVVDEPGDFKEVLAAAKKLRQDAGVEEFAEGSRERRAVRGGKGEVARAIADGSSQPYNDQGTSLARRRREGGRGQESFKELASEFGS